MGLAQGSTSRHQLNLPRTWGGKSLCFALVHPFSGSDATSQFNGKGKMSAWKAWKKYLATTAGCTSASQDGFVALEFTYAASRLTDRFTCIMYDSTTSSDKMNDLRQDILPTRVRLWKSFLRPKQHCFNTQTDVFTKPVSGEIA